MPADYKPTRELLTPDELATTLKISRKGVARLVRKEKSAAAEYWEDFVLI